MYDLSARCNVSLLMRMALCFEGVDALPTGDLATSDTSFDHKSGDAALWCNRVYLATISRGHSALWGKAPLRAVQTVLIGIRADKLTSSFRRPEL